MKQTVSLGVFLMALWLLLSGHFTPLLMTFGLASVILTLLISQRMKLIDRQSHPIHLLPKLLRYWLILFGKIVTANIDVAARILGFKPVEPHLIRLKLEQHSDLSKVIYANAITLTPGSASLHIEDGWLYVHTLSRAGAEALLEGDMLDGLPDDPKDQEQGQQL